MAKNLIKVADLNSIQYEPDKYLYYIKRLDDGVFLCKSQFERKGRPKKGE